ncbi:glycoside hydrolase family 99-like domain-containing protein [Azorhizobium doebereinerae]|uniref:glycoside hydrolase family 99-like domain-containing protein n=1 Tax=Azorhizobium doebereinerae TaxID=281091 RepID=UPI0003F9F6A8|nr:glycoside hydrolase family 99-like domain-containing protein [Azorhizobium doebereinerae]
MSGLRRLLRGLRYALRDWSFALFPGPISRKRAAAAAREVKRRAEGARDPAWRAALPDLAPAPPAAVQWVALYREAPTTGPGLWEATAAARPQFVRHLQPCPPGELGAYDPASEDTLRRQVALARAHGIEAFAFRVASDELRAEFPAALRRFLTTPDLDIGFCLAFAGPLPAVSPAVLEALADQRVLKVDGRPLVGVTTPEAGATVDVWRAQARSRLGSDLFLVQGFTGQERLTPGFDAAVQIPPARLPPVGTPRRIEFVSPTFSGRVDEQGQVAAAAMAQVRASHVPLFPGVSPGYDDTPERGTKAMILVSADPADAFARWLAEAAAWTDAHPVEGTRLVFLNAWNDWLRGAHLEPDGRFGHALLRAALSVRAPYVQRTEDPPAPPPAAPAPVRAGTVARVVHGFYPELLPGLIDGVDPAGLYVTTPPEREAEVRDVLAQAAPGANLRVVENRGRDVLPFLRLLPELQAAGFEHVLKLHTKRSPHQGRRGGDWLAQLSGPLLGLDRAGGLAAAFAAHPGMGMIGAEGHVLDGGAYAGSAGNGAWIGRLCREMDLPVPAQFSYVAGTMFAARLSLFAPLAGAPQVLDWFEPDMGLTDGTLAHAFERFFGVLAAAAGQGIGAVGAGGAVTPAAHPLTAGYVFAPHDGE